MSLFIVEVKMTLIYMLEDPKDGFTSIPRSIYWAIVTLTTVGYGDVYPITVGGKIFTTFIVFIGMGLVAVPTGLLASALSKTIGEDKQ